MGEGFGDGFGGVMGKMSNPYEWARNVGFQDLRISFTLPGLSIGKWASFPERTYTYYVRQLVESYPAILEMIPILKVMLKLLYSGLFCVLVFQELRRPF